MYLDTCVTGGLTGFKSNFVEGTFVEKYLGNTTTAAGTSKVSGYGIAHYILSDDYGRTANLYVPINYSEGCKFRLVSPQWIRRCEREQGIPKELQTKLDIEEDFCTLQFDKRSK